MINQPKAIFPSFTICLYFNVTEVFDAADIQSRNGDSDSSYSKELEAFFFDYGEPYKTAHLIWPCGQTQQMVW